MNFDSSNISNCLDTLTQRINMLESLYSLGMNGAGPQEATIKIVYHLFNHLEIDEKIRKMYSRAKGISTPLTEVTRDLRMDPVLIEIFENLKKNDRDYKDIQVIKIPRKFKDHWLLYYMHNQMGDETERDIILDFDKYKLDKIEKALGDSSIQDMTELKSYIKSILAERNNTGLETLLDVVGSQDD